MDFPNVTHVVQVGLPPNRDQYIHRLGVSFTLTGPTDFNMSLIKLSITDSILYNSVQAVLVKKERDGYFSEDVTREP